MLSTSDHSNASIGARRSPFLGVATGEKPSKAGSLGLHLCASVLQGVVQISTWISGVEALQAALTGLFPELPELPMRTGEASATELGLLIRSGPEELLLVSPDRPAPLDTLRQHVPANVGSITDLSHARCCIHLEGERCVDTLAKLFALDLRPDAFPQGQARLTGTHHVPCLLYRVGEHNFDMLVFSTYARDQLETVVDAALEFGVAVELV